MLRFGDFELDPASGELRKAGAPVRLPPQPAKVLALLVSRGGELVTREEIRQRVWGDGTHVDFDQSLNSCIKQIRAALEDDPDQPRYLQTLPRRGYRFLAPSPRRRWLLPAAFAAALIALVGGALFFWRPRPATGKVMLAVLPFHNLSGDPEQEYFADGLTEEMITQLGRLQPRRLGVIARTSAMRYKKSAKGAGEIGRELGVRYILEGSVRRSGDRVRVNAKLVEVRDQSALWEETCESDSADVLPVQTRVARRIAESLALELLPTAGPRTPAVENYFRGRFYWNKRNEEGFRRAIVYFERAIEQDARYAPAHAGLADCYNLLGEYYFLPPTQAFPKARAAAQKALALDPTLAEAHTSLGCVRARFDWDWRGAEQSYRRAIALHPGYATAHQWYAEFLATMGRHEEAIVEIQQAQQHDPFSLIIQVAAASIYYFARQYDRTIEVCRKVLEMDPDFLPAHQYLAAAYEQTGRPVATPHPDTLAALRNAHAVAGIKGISRGSLEKMLNHPQPGRDPSYVVAAIYAALGENNKAFLWLDRAFQERDSTLAYARVHPDLDALRSDPRFQELLQRMGL